MRYYDKKGRVEADPELKDIETIPYKQLISEYYEQEVKPFVDDAWLEEDQNKIRTSCIINFNKFFYKSIEPEASSSILERIKSLSEIESNLENDLYD
jgi:type I restriction enzyme M protein